MDLCTGSLFDVSAVPCYLCDHGN